MNCKTRVQGSHLKYITSPCHVAPPPAPLQDAQVFTCPVGKTLLAPVFPTTPTCPAGYEGADCTTDINECVRGTDDCSGEWVGRGGAGR